VLSSTKLSFIYARSSSSLLNDVLRLSTIPEYLTAFEEYLLYYSDFETSRISSLLTVST